MEIKNCAGCKWLDTKKDSRTTAKGYCCRVERSSQRYMKDAKVRDETTPRCELYEAGSFATRFKG